MLQNLLLLLVPGAAATLLYRRLARPDWDLFAHVEAWGLFTLLIALGGAAALLLNGRAANDLYLGDLPLGSAVKYAGVSLVLALALPVALRYAGILRTRLRERGTR